MPNCATPLILLKGVSKLYQTGANHTHALRQVDLAVTAGEFVAVMGPSGCGKTTLLNILGLIDRPTAGSQIFCEQDVSALPEAQLCEMRKNHIGFIFQNFNLIDDLTVAENVELALLYRTLPGRERQARVQAALDQVALAHRAQYFPGQLSGGQQQRVAIARALVGNQQLILADEPTGNLDSQQGQEVMSLLQHLHHGGTTIVMVTHSQAHADYAERTVNLFDGQLVAQTSGTALRAV